MIDHDDVGLDIEPTPLTVECEDCSLVLPVEQTADWPRRVNLQNPAREASGLCRTCHEKRSKPWEIPEQEKLLF